MKALDIGEVVRRSGFPVSTLRYYEEQGLIGSTGRRGLRRLFHPDVIERLSLIALGREAGFSLEEIAGMFAPEGDLRVDRARLAAKADELDRTIGQLAAIRDALYHAAACPAPRHLECPTFRRLAKIAVRRGSGRAARTRVAPRKARSTRGPESRQASHAVSRSQSAHSPTDSRTPPPRSPTSQ